MILTYISGDKILANQHLMRMKHIIRQHTNYGVYTNAPKAKSYKIDDKIMLKLQNESLLRLHINWNELGNAIVMLRVSEVK